MRQKDLVWFRLPRRKQAASSSFTISVTALSFKLHLSGYLLLSEVASNGYSTIARPLPGPPPFEHTQGPFGA